MIGGECKCFLDEGWSLWKDKRLVNKLAGICITSGSLSGGH